MPSETAAAVPRPPARSASAPVLSGAQAMVRSLELLGVTDVFGIPGGAIMHFYDPLMDASELRHILVRHEQGAGHAAEGFASASGRPGVAIATSGPGATNLVTAIADAYMDSVPLVCITGQVFSHLMGTDAFQEADIVGITMPITKHSFLVKDAAEIPGAIAAAFEIATTGRPGPVLVDITKDAQQAEALRQVHGVPRARQREPRLAERVRRRKIALERVAVGPPLLVGHVPRRAGDPGERLDDVSEHEVSRLKYPSARPPARARAGY